MAIIPSEQKFHTLDKDTPTKDRGSKQAQALRKVYTMADIVETAGGGGGVTQITAGTNVTIDPVSGVGNVTVNASGGGGGIGGSIAAGQIAFGAATSDEITGDDDFKISGDTLLIPNVIAHTGDESTKFGFVSASGDFQVQIFGVSFLRVTSGSVQLKNSGFTCLETLGYPGLGVEVTGQMNLKALNTAPAANNSAGTLGEIRWTSDYVYLCTATNTWVRAALATW
tara:strand:+ start:4093 stop:4770 length:678 start_codon:yes stop_codon:yes gene_type:complete